MIQLIASTNTRQGPEVVVDATPWFEAATPDQVNAVQRADDDDPDLEPHWVYGQDIVKIFRWLMKQHPTPEGLEVIRYCDKRLHPQAVLCSSITTSDFNRGYAIAASNQAVTDLMSESIVSRLLEDDADKFMQDFDSTWTVKEIHPVERNGYMHYYTGTLYRGLECMSGTWTFNDLAHLKWTEGWLTWLDRVFPYDSDKFPNVSAWSMQAAEEGYHDKYRRMKIGRPYWNKGQGFQYRKSMVDLKAKARQANLPGFQKTRRSTGPKD